MIELYYAPAACSFVPHVALEVIREATGQAYEPRLIRLQKGEHRTPEYLALNPDGKVPLLVVDGQPLTQIMAIADYLDRRFGSVGLLPADPWERAQSLSLLAWCNNTAHPTFGQIFRTQAFVESEAAQAELKRTASAAYTRLLSQLEQRVVAQADPLLGGKRPTFTDAYALTLYRWGAFVGLDMSQYPRFQAYLRRLAAVPAVATVLERERVPLELPAGA